MSNDWNVAEFREHSKLFALLNEAGQQQLLELAHPQAWTDEEVVMTEGEMGETFYVVTEGVLGIRIEQAGAAKEVATLERGAFVGEIGALVGEPRSATVVSKGEAKGLRFDGGEVQELLAAYPKVREALIKLALKRSEDNLADMLRD